MAINFDERIKNQEEVVIAGKTYQITFNDDFRKEVSRVMLKASDEINKAEKMDNKQLDNMPFDEKVKLVDDVFKTARQSMISFFDKCFGSGEGERIFKFYNRDTSSLQKIMVLLKKEADDKKNNQNRSKRNKYISNKR